MLLYKFLNFPPYNYCGVYEPMSSEEDLEETMKSRNDVTPVAPPTDLPNNPFIILCFNEQDNEWELKEIYNPLNGPNTLDDVLTYSDLRRLEYPPESDYLDAQVKNDTKQLQLYLQRCAEVKAKYPVTMQPITRRQYFQLKYPLFKVDEQAPNITTVTIAPTDCQPLLTVTNKVLTLQNNLQELHAYDVLELKAAISNIKEQLDVITTALRKKFII